MALSDAIRSEIKKNSDRGVCKVVRLADLINSDEDKELYLRVLDARDSRDPDYISIERLSQVIGSEGYEVSASSIARHRNGQCICTKRSVSI